MSYTLQDVLLGNVSDDFMKKFKELEKQAKEQIKKEKREGEKQQKKNKR
jgi:hypothetical protein